MKALVLLALAACTDYAQLSLKNAPGNVDLARPVAHENGDPARVEPPDDPGFSTVIAAFAPYILGGAGRYASHEPTGEAGFEIHVERADHGRIVPNTWSINTGMAIAQWSQGVRTVVPGAFYAELGYRHVFGATGIPLDVALGPLLYVDDSSAGAQLTMRWYVFMIRTRVANTGVELFGGAEIPIPFLFEQSK